MRDRTLIACPKCGRGILPRDVICAVCEALARKGVKRLIIAGSRSVTNWEFAEGAITDALASHGWEPLIILSGGADGADRIGERWARKNGLAIVRYPADWSLGKKAGPLRNAAMVANADALLALWDGVSKGTRDVINRATKAGLYVDVCHLSKEQCTGGDAGAAGSA